MREIRILKRRIRRMNQRMEERSRRYQERISGEIRELKEMMIESMRAKRERQGGMMYMST